MYQNAGNKVVNAQNVQHLYENPSIQGNILKTGLNINWRLRSFMELATASYSWFNISIYIADKATWTVQNVLILSS